MIVLGLETVVDSRTFTGWPRAWRDRCCGKLGFDPCSWCPARREEIEAHQRFLAEQSARMRPPSTDLLLDTTRPDRDPAPWAGDGFGGFTR